MGFIKHRPSLPIGTSVPGGGAVQRPLHVDESFEVYLLQSGQTGNTVLVRAVEDLAGGWFPSKALPGFWGLQSENLLLVQDFPTRRQDQGSVFEAVLECPGEWLGERREMEEPDLWKLLIALMNMVERVADSTVFPNLQPSCLWWLSQPEAVLCVLASPKPPDPEMEAVARIGKLIYWVASGIDSTQRQPPKPLPPLRRWSRCVGEELSGLVARCVAPNPSTGRTETLASLRAELRKHGGIKTQSLKVEPSSTKCPTTSSSMPSASLRGLARVAGMRELKELLEREVIKPLRDPTPYQQYGLTVPNGVLLYGPPGCGKTYIARQLAEELGYYFVEVLPSEVASPYIHQSVLRIRDLFDTAVERAPSILFIDEFEALVPSRSDLGGHQQYKAEEVNEFLAHLNDCASKNVFVIAATNEPQKIDAAVRRTGRLDKLIYVGPPDSEARAEMLSLHLAHRPTEKNLDVAGVAMVLEGYSASDIKFLVDEAARAALQKEVPISTAIFLETLSRVPPSVSKEDEERYKGFISRGI